jgi:alpha-D-ribose 1-methylphosphonate 5-triphosphate synthase subunit PhnI
MTQSNDLSQRIDRNDGQIVDLQLAANLLLQAIDKNSADIAQLLEVTRRNSENIAALQLAQMRNEAGLQVFREHTDDAIQDIRASIAALTASNERMDRLMEYIIRRDRGALE